MSDLTDSLARLRRPRLLLEAATEGTRLYERRRDLRRMLRVAIPETAPEALALLLPVEAALEHRRVTADTNYALTRHVDVLTAILAEARDLTHDGAVSLAAARRARAAAPGRLARVGRGGYRAGPWTSPPSTNACSSSISAARSPSSSPAACGS
jgi:hypothetical protein